MRKLWLIYPVLLLALMTVIFCFSAQPADDSSATSSRFAVFASRVLLTNFEDFDNAGQAQIIDGLTFLVRKTAHFSEYALMGFLWYLWLHRKRFAPLLALGLSAAYAASDELHQAFVPGRSCELRDVLVDTSGAACGILAAFLLLCVVWCVRHREIVHWGTWK